MALTLSCDTPTRYSWLHVRSWCFNMANVHGNYHKTPAGSWSGFCGVKVCIADIAPDKMQPNRRPRTVVFLLPFNIPHNPEDIVLNKGLNSERIVILAALKPRRVQYLPERSWRGEEKKKKKNKLDNYEKKKNMHIHTFAKFGID